jgi:hypothetical protein
MRSTPACVSRRPKPERRGLQVRVGSPRGGNQPSQHPATSSRATSLLNSQCWMEAGGCKSKVCTLLSRPQA